MNLKQISRRALMLVALAAAGLSQVAQAEERPLEWVVGYAAGGGSDAVARTVGDAMSKTLGRPIVINNKPGAATNIAAQYVAGSKDYGNIMFTADFATLAANPWLFKKLPYNADKDFVPVGLLARFPMLLVVHPSVPAKNYKEFVAWAKADPGGINYASAGNGSPHHLAGELLRDRTGLKMQHVPYRGAAPAVQDLVGGMIKVAVMDSASVQQYIAAGKLRAIGVASPARLNVMPEVPTLAEQGLKDYIAYAWQGLVVPAGTPQDTVNKLSQALQAALDSTPVKARFQVLALEAMRGTPQQMAEFARNERQRWGKVVQTAGIQLD